ncbi:MAG: B12-binding domain-containing radical SAM protein [Candidatus Omnitrophica bacterium]|nr:B12-binding domain-containing radical SAM protein [Candidatus Omnitrophota bacterium]
MKICLGYPSLDDPRGFHQVGQNRQAQVFSAPAFIYPYIPAMAATLLKRAGHEILWLDGPAEGLTWAQQLQQLETFQPDLLAWEVKTPSVIGTWGKVDAVKQALPRCATVLMGDHVTALPQESLDRCAVDIALTGGDYDFGLVEIAKRLSAGESVRGVFHQPTTGDLKTLPVVDRQLTKWRLYGYERGSGNYKYLPGTHSMAGGRDCWWRHDGGCTFCSWTNTFKNWRVGTVDQFMAEVESCASLGIRELFDDTGTFPIGAWLQDCCERLIKFNEGKRHGRCRVTIGCNMRPGALKQSEWNLLGRAGFRFILFGLESANHETLVRINKGQKEHDMETSARMAKGAGLEPHVTCMVGYPWESKEGAARTIRFTQELFARGWIDTLQATICIPYPGTALYRQCVEHGWLKYPPGDWNQWDMSKPVMTPGDNMSDDEVLAMTRGIYKSFVTPRFLVRKLISVRSRDDLKFLARGARLLWGHLTDFSGRRPQVAVH